MSRENVNGTDTVGVAVTRVVTPSITEVQGIWDRAEERVMVDGNTKATVLY